MLGTAAARRTPTPLRTVTNLPVTGQGYENTATCTGLGHGIYEHSDTDSSILIPRPARINLTGFRCIES